MKNNIIKALLTLSCLVYGSGGYDNGTSNGKGKFKIDLTWNPLNKLEFGQSYAILSYGLTNKLDIHGYISHHPGNYNTWYGGIFYQFLDTKRLHLATAVGIRQRSNKNWKHIFLPQLLYTVNITDKLYFGGSFVEVRDLKSFNKYGLAIDIAMFYQLKYNSKIIESISIGIGGFHPATWTPDKFFVPTYSVDFHF